MNVIQCLTCQFDSKKGWDKECCKNHVMPRTVCESYEKRPPRQPGRPVVQKPESMETSFYRDDREKSFMKQNYKDARRFIYNNIKSKTKLAKFELQHALLYEIPVDENGADLIIRQLVMNGVVNKISPLDYEVA
jgi:hypothetical protein